MNEYIIKVMSPTPPKLYVGDNLHNAEIIAVELADKKDKLMTTKELAEYTGFSRDTINKICKSINQGTKGKALYRKDLALELIKNDGKPQRKGRGGRGRKN